MTTSFFPLMAGLGQPVWKQAFGLCTINNQDNNIFNKWEEYFYYLWSLTEALLSENSQEKK